MRQTVIMTFSMNCGTAYLTNMVHSLFVIQGVPEKSIKIKSSLLRYV